MAWHKIAQTASLVQLHDTYKLELYQELSSAPGSVETLIIQNDFKLRRGNPSAKNKFQRILNTTIDFNVWDVSKYLIDVLRSAPEYEFKGIILKNSATFYAGYVTLLLDNLYYKRSNIEVGIKLYDGLNRLKEFTDLTDIGTGLVSLKEIVRTIFNALNLNLDISAYQNIFTGSDENDPDARALWLEYFKIEDLINTLGNNASYYDVLTFLANLFDWNIFQENGIWVLRQNASIKHVAVAATDGIWREDVEYDTGNYQSTKVDLDNAMDDTDLQVDPISFEYQKLDQVEITVPSYLPEGIPQFDEATEEPWLNPFFREGSRGWTTDAGTPEYRDDAAYLDPTEQISQQYTGFTSGEKFRLKLSVSAIRMVLDAGDVLLQWYDNPLAKIVYYGSVNTYYLGYASGEYLVWNTTNNNNKIWGFPMAGMPTAGTYKKIYNRQTLELDAEITLPAEAGDLEIQLFGGGTASGNNYPYEQGAIHHFCIVEKVEDSTGLPTSVPDRLIHRAYIADAKEIQKINLPFADYNPFNGATIWYLEETTAPAAVNYYRAYDWSPDNGTLIENIAERIIKQNRSRRGFDLLLLPGVALRFINLIEADFEDESATYYYLPVFEETRLIADHKRFVLLEHNYDSPTITTKHEFIFANSPQQ